MAINTYQTYLMTKGAGSTWTKLVDIKEFPDLNQATPTLDSTTLSDPAHTYISDIKDTGGTLEFTANYSLADYQSLVALEGQRKEYAVWFGATTADGVDTPDGSHGKFEFEGELSVWKKGAGVSTVQEMGIGIAPTKPIQMSVS